MSDRDGGIGILAEDYCGIYSDGVRKIPGWKNMSYGELAGQVYSKGYFYGDAWINGFKNYGISARQFVPQCNALQSRWARENGLSFPPEWMDRFPIRGLCRRLLRIDFPSAQEKSEQIVTAQIKEMRPKVLWVFSGVHVSAENLDEWRRYCGKICLWHSCPLWPNYPFKRYDAIFTCLPGLVEHFRSLGNNSFLIPHAFDERVLSRVTPSDKRREKVVFVGNLGGIHRERTEFLDKLSRRVGIDYYGPNCDGLPSDSPLRQNYRGPAWGDDLYSVYGAYLLTIHLNIDIAEQYPTAKRLYEATGMGICFLTNAYKGIGASFEPHREIVTFDGLEDAEQRIRELLKEPATAAAIGLKGQARTLRDHTYDHRISIFLAHCRQDLGISF